MQRYLYGGSYSHGNPDATALTDETEKDRETENERQTQTQTKYEDCKVFQASGNGYTSLWSIEKIRETKSPRKNHHKPNLSEWK